jgi:predicted HicB family RNase H-like nuclease
VSNENERKIRKPGRGDERKSYSGKCDVRLSSEEDSILNALASRNNVSRSDVMRKALRDFWKFNSDEE